MFSFIKQVFIVLLSLSSSLERVAKASDRTKFLSLNNEPCMIRPTLIGLNPVELKYYLFMISLDKCNRSWNVLPLKTCVSKDDCKCKFSSATCNSAQKCNNETCQCEYKNFRTHKKDYSWNPSTCICEKSKYLKNIADTSVIACDEIISVMDIASTKMTNTIATNVSVNCHNKKVRYKIDFYILHAILLAIILLLMITIAYYHYAKYRSKEKDIDALAI